MTRAGTGVSGIAASRAGGGLWTRRLGGVPSRLPRCSPNPAARVRSGDGTGPDQGKRSTESTESRQRHVEHQSSIRSLISSSNIGSNDIEREIEAFARQIQEEGLLEGLDLDHVDLGSNDELSRRITEAYRRRHRERTRNNGTRGSDAVAHHATPRPGHRSPSPERQYLRGRQAGRDLTRNRILGRRAPRASQRSVAGRLRPAPAFSRFGKKLGSIGGGRRVRAAVLPYLLRRLCLQPELVPDRRQISA